MVNVLFVFLHNELSKIGILSILERRVHINNVEKRVYGMREGLRLW